MTLTEIRKLPYSDRLRAYMKEKQIKGEAAAALGKWWAEEGARVYALEKAKASGNREQADGAIREIITARLAG